MWCRFNAHDVNVQHNRHALNDLAVQLSELAAVGVGYSSMNITYGNLHPGLEFIRSL